MDETAGAITDVDGLKTLDLAQLAAAVSRGLPDPGRLGPGDWHLIREMLSTRLGWTDRDLVGEHWPLIARAYDAVLASAVAAGALTVREQTLAHISFRVGLIGRIGVHRESGTLDPAALVRTVLVEVPVTFERAWSAAEIWRTLELPHVRDLRCTRQLLNPLLTLIEMGHDLGDADPMLQRWLDLAPRLP